MNLRFNSVVFAIVFCIGYAIAFWFNKPLLTYYPQIGAIVWGPTRLVDVGPGMAWYGLMADAGIAALVFAFAVPDRVVARALQNYLWLFPLAAMLICLYLLRPLFFH